jgi:hypothetical protein
MTEKEKILVELDFGGKDDYIDFHIKIEEKIKNLPLPLRKRIIACSTELIQNNFIHNNNMPMNFQIAATSKNILIRCLYHQANKKLIQLTDIIENINSFSFLKLKELYLNNLTSNTNGDTTGNGLIICKLKSKNNINIFIDKHENNFLLELKFDYDG